MSDEWFGDSDEASASGPRRPGGFEPRVLSGTFAGARWQVMLDPERPRIAIDGREIHVEPDGIGSFVTHAMVGRWNDLALLAQAIVRYHPDYSPLARRRNEPVA